MHGSVRGRRKMVAWAISRRSMSFLPLAAQPLLLSAAMTTSIFPPPVEYEKRQLDDGDNAVCFSTQCQDDPFYTSPVGMSCADHHGLLSSDENCLLYWHENNGRMKINEYVFYPFAEAEVMDMIAACPCACNFDCNKMYVPSVGSEPTPRDSPSSSPPTSPIPMTSSTAPMKSEVSNKASPAQLDGDGDDGVCFDSRCRDDPLYTSNSGLSCDDLLGLLTSNENCFFHWVDSGGQVRDNDLVTYDVAEEELIDIIRACPCACNVYCGETHTPTTSPSPETELLFRSDQGSGNGNKVSGIEKPLNSGTAVDGGSTQTLPAWLAYACIGTVVAVSLIVSAIDLRKRIKRRTSDIDNSSDDSTSEIDNSPDDSTSEIDNSPDDSTSEIDNSSDGDRHSDSDSLSANSLGSYQEYQNWKRKKTNERTKSMESTGSELVQIEAKVGNFTLEVNFESLAMQDVAAAASDVSAAGLFIASSAVQGVAAIAEHVADEVHSVAIPVSRSSRNSLSVGALQQQQEVDNSNGMSVAASVIGWLGPGGNQRDTSSDIDVEAGHATANEIPVTSIQIPSKF